MVQFWLITSALLAIALIGLAPYLLRPTKTVIANNSAQNIRIARERLSQLESDLAQGQIEQADFDAGKLELEQTLLQDMSMTQEIRSSQAGFGKITFIVLLIVIPLAAYFLYQTIGSPELASDSRTEVWSTHKTASAAQPVSAPVETKATAASMAKLAEKLRQRLEEKNPDDVKGWFLLGRTYIEEKDYVNAAYAFDKAHALTPTDANTMLALADALSMTNGGSMAGRPAELVAKALAIAPENTTGQWMNGMVAEGEGDYVKALSIWEALYPKLAATPDQQVDLALRMKQAAMKGGLAMPAALNSSADMTSQSEPAIKEVTPATTAAGITLNITLSNELAARVKPNDALFIYVKAVNGPRFPLAAKRLSVSDLPLNITLSDADAMMPAAKISDFSNYRVGARVSSSGNAIASPGDLFGEKDVTAPVTPVEIQINTVKQ